MKTLTTSVLLTLISVSIIFAQESEQFTGKFDTELKLELKDTYQLVFKPDTTVTYRFAEPLEAGATITAGTVYDGVSVQGRSTALLVEPPKGAPYICLDINANGTIEAGERFVFAAHKEAPDILDVILKIPIKNPLFPVYPIFLQYQRGFKHPSLPANGRLLLQSSGAYATGLVDIRGRKVLFQYQFDPRAATISTTQGLFGVDVDGDGKIKNETFSLESSYASDSEIVFRLGDLYISTAKTDMARNEIVVRKRDKAEYSRHELEIGKEMPDFTFVDLDGKSRKLAELRGKYLLVDFWGVWCVDCRRETPFQVEAYKRFHSRGFDILGLDWDDDVEKVRDYMTKTGITWMQARKDSIVTLTEVNYRIQEFPSSVLIGPDGKVLVMDQEQLQDEELAKTLDRLLPKDSK